MVPVGTSAWVFEDTETMQLDSTASRDNVEQRAMLGADADPARHRRSDDADAKFEQRIEQLGNEWHTETNRLRQVDGVGAITPLTFVRTLEGPIRCH